MLEKQVLRYLESLSAKQAVPLRVKLWDGSQIDLAPDPEVAVVLKTPGAARHFMKPTLSTLGESFVDGEIDVEGPIGRLVDVAEQLVRATDESSSIRGKTSSWMVRHTRKSDKKAIEYHYDVSNEFYSLWLDPAMVYSCAYFTREDEPLADAQVHKLDHICRKLMLAPGESLLDLGCGWGALVIHAARHYGVRAVGVTLSENQLQLATERVAAAGLSQQIEIRLQDYRDIPGENVFDKISSVGMFEHVGLKNLDAYFQIVHRLLRPGGIALNHGITASDVDSRSVGLGAGDFIDRHVFPDGELPHVSLAIRELARAGLELSDAESLRRHYARTLEYWSAAFERNLDKLTELAGERRTRIWRTYLAGCAHAFKHGWVNIYQLQAVKPDRQPQGALSPLPLTRDYLYAD